ncbi:MAG: AAA family ATPase [Acidobacteria bacterium]|nr:AAA family ATPase [Acidobacteriota bacterium]
MLTKLEIQNFKAFGQQVRLDLRPLTVFVGANGAGKTSALEAIGLLSQSTPAAEQVPQFRWRDRLVDLGANGASAFHKPENDLQLALTIEVEAGEHLRAWLHKHNYDPVVQAQTVGYSVGHRRGSDEWKHHLFVNGEVAATNATMSLGRGLVKRGQGAFLECASTRLPERVFEPAISGNAVLSPRLFMGVKAIGGKEVDDATHHAFITFGLMMSFLGAYLKQRVFMIGASRMPAREAPLLEPGPLTVGRRGERTITVLSVMFAHPKHLQQARKIQYWAEIFGLGSLTSGWVREELLHAGYLDCDYDAPLGFESAGCGAQQILPVITQIFSAPSNSVILVEEPEASLHPEAQTHLARMLADAVKQGHQLLISTHSQPLLEALGEACKAEHLNRNDVAVFHLAKSPAGAVCETIDLDRGLLRKHGGLSIAASR